MVFFYLCVGLHILSLVVPYLAAMRDNARIVMKFIQDVRKSFITFC